MADDNVTHLRPVDQLARDLDQAPLADGAGGGAGAPPKDPPRPSGGPGDSGKGRAPKPEKEHLPAARKNSDRPPGEIWKGCPVTPLGFNDDRVYLIDVHGQMKTLVKIDIQSIAKLFGNRQHLLWHRYPTFARGSDKPQPMRFDATTAASDIISACADKGMFDPVGTVRGVGAWADDDGNLIYHCGDVLLLGDREIPPSAMGGKIYPAAPPIPHPAIKVTDPGPMPHIREEVESWRWRRGDLDAQIAIGMICCMILGGALEWRPSFWITGGKATGKSRLQRLIMLLMGGEKGLLKAENATAASISNFLRLSTLPVALDELEPGDQGSPKEKAIIELMRIASSGGRRIRSNPDQSTTETVIRSTFIASSILIPGALKPQDRSRLIILDLDPFPEGHETPPPLRADKWHGRGHALKRILIDRWATWAARLECWRMGLALKGVDGRNGDNWATVLAMADMAENADLPAPEAVAGWAVKVAKAIRNDLTEIGSDADDVITWLLTQMIDPMRKGQAHTIATWLKVAAQRPGAARRLFGDDAFANDADRAKTANRYLAPFGLRVIGSVEEPVLFVATKQMAGLKTLFEKSDWAGGAWTQSLQRVPGAKASTASRYLEGIQTRGSEIPFASIPGLMALDSEDGGLVPAPAPVAGGDTGDQQEDHY